MQTKLSDGTVMIAGNVTKEAELKYVGEKNRAVTSFSIIVGKRKDTTPIYVTVKAWGRLAEYANAASKGDAVCAIGRLETREYNGKEYTDVVCDWLNIAGGTSETKPAQELAYGRPVFEELPDDLPL